MAFNSFISRQAKKAMFLRYYFGDDLGFDFYYRHPRNYNRRAVFSINEPALNIRGVNSPVPKGYKGNPNDAAPITPNMHVLSIDERVWIQTFTKTFQWVGTKTQIEQMIRNAVPVNLAK